MAATAVGKIERAHQMYRDGQHEEALGFYTEALSMAKTKPQRIALHSNRAACYLKLHDFKKAAEECTSVLELDHQHAGALMLRAQTLVTMKEYQSALFDVNRLMELNPSSDVYRNLQARLRTQLSLAPIPESEEELLVLEEDDEAEEKGEEDEDEEKEDNKNEEQQKIVIQDVVKKIESPKKTNVRVIQLCNAKEDVARKFEHINKPEAAVLRKLNGEDSVVKKIEFNKPKDRVIQRQNVEDSADARPKGWGAIPKPKGHSGLDYSRWDQVEDDSSEDEEDEEEEQQPRYRFRVRTVGVRPVK